MSTYWNYRVIAKKLSTGEIQYGFHEVHYEDDIPVGYTENPISALSFNNEGKDPIDSLKWQLDAMKLACDKPVLDDANFPNEYKKYSRKKKLELIEKLLDDLLESKNN